MTHLEAGLYNWLNIFARSSFLRDFGDEEAKEIMREVEEKCRVDCQDASGKWWIIYTRMRVGALSR